MQHRMLMFCYDVGLVDSTEFSETMKKKVRKAMRELCARPIQTNLWVIRSSDEKVMREKVEEWSRIARQKGERNARFEVWPILVDDVGLQFINAHTEY